MLTAGKRTTTFYLLLSAVSNWREQEWKHIAAPHYLLGWLRAGWILCSFKKGNTTCLSQLAKVGRWGRTDTDIEQFFNLCLLKGSCGLLLTWNMLWNVPIYLSSILSDSSGYLYFQVYSVIWVWDEKCEYVNFCDILSYL